MEDVSSVLMDIYPVNIFRIDISRDIRSSVYNKTLIAVICGKARESRTI